MTFNFCELYTLPIDNTYTNVFDWNITDTENIGTQIQNSLTAHYQYFRINMLSTRSIKNRSENATITIPIAFEECRKYNYVCLATFDGAVPTKQLFYFITEWISENDSQSAPSTTLQLQYDVWTNNYKYLAQNNYNHIQHTSCRHIQRYSKTQNNDYTITDNFIRTKEGEPDSNSYSYSVDPTTKLANRRVAWLRITLKPVGNSAYAPSYDGITTFPSFIYYNNIKQYNYYSWQIFKPLYVVEEGNKKSNLRLRYKGKYVSTDGSIKDWDNWQLLDASATNMLDIAEEYISVIDITFHPPFQYNLNIDNVEGESIYSIKADSFGSFVLLVNSDGSARIVSRRALAGYTVYNKSYENIYNKEFNTDTYTRDELISINENFDYSKEPFYLFYPFNYDFILIGDKKIPLDFITTGGNVSIRAVPHATCTKIYLDIKDRMFDYLKDKNLITVSSNGSIPFSVNSLSEYLASNNSRFNTEFTIKNLSTMYSTFSTAVYDTIQLGYGNIDKIESLAPNIIGMGKYMMRRNAYIKDLSSSPELESIPSALAENSEFIQDNILIYHNNVNASTNNFKSICEKIKKFGYNIDRDSDIISNTRLLFDYVKTDDCTLPTIPNTYDRKQLEGIFDSGVRRWHIENFNQYGTYKEQAENLNYNLTNPDINVWNNV